jgi:tRNA U34 2-thiouridine synthase MnmA/TrmU
MEERVKGLALLSGGLDSILAVRVLAEQGVPLAAVHFSTPFSPSASGTASVLAGAAGVTLLERSYGAELIASVLNPRHAKGRHLNPCIDCKIGMFRKAGEMIRDEGYGFLVTGEVMGQRPLSQHLKALMLIEREAGLERLVLRPLSAGVLPPTIPEERGWVDRARLLAIEGRSRKAQLALAARFGIADPPTPAGGCLLTDPAFSRRLGDAMRNGRVVDGRLVEVLRHGRVYSMDGPARLVVGRNQADNEALESLKAGDERVLKPVSAAGPTALALAGFPAGSIPAAASVVARYTDHEGDGPVEVEVSGGGGATEVLAALPGIPPGVVLV